MSRSFRLGPAGLLAALGALVAVACGTDTIELLPLNSGGSGSSGGGTGGRLGGGSGGADSTASGAGAGGVVTPAGGGGTGGAGNGGTAGAFSNGGKGGGYGCFGSACGGFSGAGGGSYSPCPDPTPPWCTPCSSNDDCREPERCNLRVGLCLPGCTTTTDCTNEGHVCDPTYKTCGPCFNDDQCAERGNPKRRACELSLGGRCVECNERVACTQGVCSLNQCVECRNDSDCMGRPCDEIHGRCL